MSRTYYIGFATSSHDPAIAIVSDSGEVLFAEGAERYYQVKRAIGCPPDNIIWAQELISKYCKPGSHYVIATSWASGRVKKMWRYHAFGALDVFSSKLARNFILRGADALPISIHNVRFFFKNFIATTAAAAAGIERAIATQAGSKIGKYLPCDHHLTHATFACYGSPFTEATCLVADGAGEEGSFSICRYQKGKIVLVEKQKGRVSIGGFYGRLTMFCGFDQLKGEEWKVMGLAAYGTFDSELHQLFRSMFRVVDCHVVAGEYGIAEVARRLEHITSRTANQLSLRANIAYNGQLAYSEWMNELLTNIHRKYPSDNLVLSGGCALNSSHNGTITTKTPFKKLHVSSAPADDGNALGAALLAYYTDHQHNESIHKSISPYLGTEITDEQLQHFLKFSGQKVRELASDKYDTVAHLLANGKIVGWVQGRSEFGPRALGNRSILADPRSTEIKDIINERVKFREEFRPFAPSILHEHGHEYFEHYQESHYMERTLAFTKEAITKVPGVVHADNTGRLQTVKEEWNKEFYQLLKSFHNITGIPVLLNTSFNVMGKPIIHSVEDAISTFLTSGLDALVINNYLVEK